MSQQPLVLIVDDDQNIRHVLARLFTSLGFATAEAETNSEALAQALLLQPQLITTDMSRAGGSGLSLVEQIRTSAPIQSIPIVMISGSASEADREQAEQLGNTVTMWKPFTPAKIPATVERVFPRDQWGNLKQRSTSNPTS